MDGLLSFTVLVILLAFPTSVGAAAYCWRLHRVDMHDYPGPRLRFSLVLAITGSLAAIGSALLVLDAVYTVTRFALLKSLTLPTLCVAVMILDVIPILNAVFLRLRRTRHLPLHEEILVSHHGSDGEPLHNTE